MFRPSAAAVWAVVASVATTTLPLPAQAALIGTDEAVRAATTGTPAAEARARVAAGLAREDVQAALRARGVDAAEVQARVDALSDADVQLLADRVDQLPAGSGDILGVLVFIFVLLLVTDILGLTKVFPFTRSVR